MPANRTMKNFSPIVNKIALSIALALTTFSCDTDTDPIDVYQVPAAIEPFVERFVQEAAARGISLNVTNLVVEIGLLTDEDEDVAGTCTNGGLTTPLIRLDTTKNWWSNGDMIREEVIFHEFGHCLLGRPHQDDVLPNGDFASIMRTKSPGLYAFYEFLDVNLSYKRDYYLSELFDEFTDPPCWIDESSALSLDFFPEFNTDGFNTPRQFLADGQDVFWISTFQNLFILNSSEVIQAVNNTNSNFQAGFGNALAVDQNGALWVANNIEGQNYIWKHDGALSFTLVYQSEQNPTLPNINISALSFDTNNRLWLATFQGELAIEKSDGTFEVFNENNSDLPAGSVPKLAPGTAGNMFILLGKSFILDPGDHQFQIFNFENASLPNQTLTNIVTDQQGNAWISSDYQLLRYKIAGNQFEALDMIDFNMPYSNITELVWDTEGNLWVATRLGLRKLIGERFSDFCSYHLGFDHWDTSTLGFDPQGRVWVSAKELIRFTQ